MSEEDKNINISPVPKFVDNALTNITDAPTKQMGSTFGDIWFLVFGGISHLAEKRKMKYALALDKYHEELNKEIDRIPLENRIEPDTQVIAPALEASKYCVEKDELRSMFVNLIASSMNSEKEALVHPIFTDVIKRLSAVDACLLQSISTGEFGDDSIIFSVTVERLSFSLAVLKHLGLIESKDLDYNAIADTKAREYLENNIIHFKYNKSNLHYISHFLDDSFINSTYDIIFTLFTNYMKKNKFSGDTFPVSKTVIEYFSKTIQLTPLGQRFKTICIDL